MTASTRKWPSLGELAVKTLMPLLLTPVMLVMVPMLLLGQSSTSGPYVIGLCPITVAMPDTSRIENFDLKVIVGTCADEAEALRKNERHALIRAGSEDGQTAAKVLFKASRSAGRESLPAARRVAMALTEDDTPSASWPEAVAVDGELELAVGMLVIVLPALLLQWIVGGVAPHLLQAVSQTPASRADRLHLHRSALLLAAVSSIGYLVGLSIATAIGNYINGGTLQVIKELDATVSPSPALISNVEISAAFMAMAASFVVFITPAMVWLATTCRSRVAFSALLQVLGLSLIIGVMVFGYAISVRPVPYAELIPLISSTSALNDLVRDQFVWPSLLTTLVVNAAFGALFLFLSLKAGLGAHASASPAPAGATPIATAAGNPESEP